MPVPDASVIINAAGRGSRLARGTNKSLLPLLSKPLLEWQLENIPPENPVIVGIGFQAEEVARLALRLRPNATLVYNPDFAATGTARTLFLASQITTGRIVSLDGDLLVDGEHLRMFLSAQADVLGVVPAVSTDPVYCRLTDVDNRGSCVTGFARKPRGAGEEVNEFEWSGLASLLVESLDEQHSYGHVYEMIENLLPLPARLISAAEIDFETDIAVAEEWLIQRGTNRT